MKLTLEQQYMLSVLHRQYHVCWCSDNFRSQGISTHGIDPQSQNIPSPASLNSQQNSWVSFDMLNFSSITTRS